MRCEAIKDLVSNALALELGCRHVAPGHTMISSPFMNLDGDYPEVHVIADNVGGFLLTDYGEVFRGLLNNNIDGSDTESRAGVLQRLNKLLGVEHVDGRFQLAVSSDADLGTGLVRMFQALAFAEDLIFTASPRDEAVFNDRVSDSLESLEAKLQRNQPLKGVSGRQYSVDFRVHRTRDVWIEAISATTKGSFRQQVNNAYTMWSDAGASVRRITLLDDTSPVMDSSAIHLLQGVTNVELWSDQEAFRRSVVDLIASPQIS